MVVSVKICGITEAGALDAALSAGADYVGLVFHPGSPRHVQADQARQLAAQARARARVVALLVDPDDASVARAIAAAKPDFLQLHGRESPERLGFLRSHFGLPLIKAFAVAEAEDLAPVPRYEPVADLLLFDARAPSGSGRPGGHGMAFDWRLLPSRRFGRPWLLAGGLDAGNVALALAVSGAPGVDVSSGVETAPGIKDPERIRRFIAAARGVRPTEANQGSSA